jgi:hypothetical protein
MRDPLPATVAGYGMPLDSVLPRGTAGSVRQASWLAGTLLIAHTLGFDVERLAVAGVDEPVHVEPELLLDARRKRVNLCCHCISP